MAFAHLRRFLTTCLILGTAGVLIVSCAGNLRVPGVGPPDLTLPVDRLTAARLQLLTRDDALCRAVLAQAQIRHTALPPLSAGRCGYTNAVRLQQGRPPAVGFRPDVPGMSCAMAAAVTLWLRDIVQPAAQTHLGSRVTAIDHYGAYACRNTYGREAGDLSEHARANALDIAGFRLADGRQVTVLRNWQGSAAEQAFLREVRDGGCRLFGTSLSPDYNEAHRDHFHFDMASRGGGLFGGFCR